MALPTAVSTSLRNAYLRFKNKRGKTNRMVDTLGKYGVDLVLDVGANTGQYGQQLIRRGYQGRILSFEPLPDAYAELTQNISGFTQWKAEPFALGAEDTQATLNIAGNSQSSSLHNMLDRHLESAPDSAYVGSVQVPVRRLDSVISQYAAPDEKLFLKVDVQGHEAQVLEGASGCFDSIMGIELELSMAALYEGQHLWHESIDAMRDLGFELADISPCFCDPKSSVMLQADGVFVRRTEAERLQRAA